jgi:hypothetical protein
MPRALSTSAEDAGASIRRARLSVYLVRAACCHLRAFAKRGTPLNVCRSMYGGDPITEQILTRAATAPAEIGVAGWAQEISRVAIFDLVASATSISAGADVIGRGLRITMDGIGEHRVPGRILSSGSAGQWVAEATAAPVRQLSFSNAAILQPRRLSVLLAFSREQVESSNIEGIVRQTLQEATGLAIGPADVFEQRCHSCSTSWALRRYGRGYADCRWRHAGDD